MRRVKVEALALVAALGTVPAGATSVRQMNLAEMCERADMAFRGVVVHARPGEVELAGGRLPVVIYRIRVEEGFKGRFSETGGERFVDLKLLGDAKAPRRGVRMLMPGLQPLQAGQSYLLFTTRPGPAGLAATVGLGQGAFRVRRTARGETAVNALGNRDLLRGMGSAEPAGPMTYERLAAHIRDLVRGGGER